MLRIGEAGYVPLMGWRFWCNVLMYCWHRGTAAVAARLLANRSRSIVMAKLEQDRVARVPGTACS